MFIYFTTYDLACLYRFEKFVRIEIGNVSFAAALLA